MQHKISTKLPIGFCTLFCVDIPQADGFVFCTGNERSADWVEVDAYNWRIVT